MKENNYQRSGFTKQNTIPKSFEGGAPRNKKNPTINDINWRALNARECERLFFATAKGQVLKTIIDSRKSSMLSADFDQWRFSLCDYL